MSSYSYALNQLNNGKHCTRAAWAVDVHRFNSDEVLFTKRPVLRLHSAQIDLGMYASKRMNIPLLDDSAYLASEEDVLANDWEIISHKR